MGKEGEFKKHKGSIRGIREKDEYVGEEAGKIDIAEERDFRRGELLGKYTVKMLYGWNDRKFKEEYLRKLERN